MKKQTISAFVAILCAGSIFAGCGSGDAKETTPPTTEPTVAETTVPTETTAPTTPETTVPETTVPETTESSEETQAQAPSSSGNYVDLNNMQFTINDKTYTLGKTTLQELIDDGVPFREDDLANANNNLNKNSQSQGFRIELAEYWTAQVFALNDTDGNKSAAECYINEVYLPVHQDKTQNILSFAFPLNVTMDDLKANAGEPTEVKHFDGEEGYYTDTLEYTTKSTKYYGDSGYTFEFTKDELKYVTIEYLP